MTAERRRDQTDPELLHETMRQKRFMMVAILVPCLALVACDPPAEPPVPLEAPEVEVRDSAGLRIVVNHADTAGLPLWAVDTVPVVRIGHDGEDIHHQFVQIDHAVLYPDGRVAIADTRTDELRMFGADGAFLRMLGRRGEGPGEFRSIGDLRLLPGDTLLAWDPSSSRVTFFGPEGEVVGTVPIERPAGCRRCS